VPTMHTRRRRRKLKFPPPPPSLRARREEQNHPSAVPLGDGATRDRAQAELPFGEQDPWHKGEGGVQEVREEVRDGS